MQITRAIITRKGKSEKQIIDAWYFFQNTVVFSKALKIHECLLYH